MSNSYFQFKQFLIQQDKSAMKVTTDACLFGAWTADQIKSKSSSRTSVLDIGTGTGLLSLILAQKSPASIDAIEIDVGAFEQARDNVSQSPWKDRVTILHTDAKHFVSPRKYDFIISNPPFYEKEIRSGDVKKNLARHGEQLSLKELLAVIKTNLRDEGRFFLLLPFKRNKEISALFKQQVIHAKKVVFVSQSPEHDFFRIMISAEFGKAFADPLFEKISIWNNDHEYTTEFIDLLKDFYLKL